MRALLVPLLLVPLLVVAPVLAAAEAPPKVCDEPVFDAYACWFGQIGAQQVTVCGENLGSFCIDLG